MLERIVRGVRAAAAGTFLAAATAVLPTPAVAQNHLTSFGFTGGCDPAYEIETRAFTNLCVLSITDDRLTDPVWFSDMVRAGRHVALNGIADIFLRDMGGGNYDLRPRTGPDGYLARWDAAIQHKERSIGGLVEYLYLDDEPDVHNVALSEINTIHDTVKADFPRTRTAVVLSGERMRSWLTQGSLKVDVVGFNRYGVYDPRTDSAYQSDLAFLAANTPGKERVIIADACYDSATHAPRGIAPDDMGDVFRNYYALAATEPDTVALVGFHWPSIGGAQCARDLPPDAQAAYRAVGANITGTCPFPPELAAFDPNVKPEHAMYFHDCRFLATIQYRIPWLGNQTGMAVAQPYSDLINNYWFFSPDNLEGVMKIFDFHPIGGTYAVFVTNVSDLPGTIRIYDTASRTLVWEHQHNGGALAVIQGFGE